MWKRDAIPGREFVSSDGKKIIIISIGKVNNAGGADFKDACILNNGKLIQGDIELHRSSKDWFRHGHHLDMHYQSVILHVIMHREELRNDQTSFFSEVPTIVLAENITLNISSSWHDVISNHSSDNKSIPCVGKNDSVSANAKYSMIAILAAQRFDEKCRRVRQRIHELHEDSQIPSTNEMWNQMLFEMIFEAACYGGNQKGMRLLARSTRTHQWDMMNTCSDSLIDRYAALIGMANLFPYMIKDFSSAEMKELSARWNSLRQYFDTEPLSQSLWNYGGIRPHNAPHRRLMFLAALLTRYMTGDLLRSLICFTAQWEKGCTHNSKQSGSLLAVQSNEKIFHYHPPQLGAERIDEIIVNVVAPLMRVMGEEENFSLLREKGVHLYFAFDSRASNSITALMKNNLSIQNIQWSGIQQGLIELHKNFCISCTCGECLIGRNRS